MYCSYPTPQNGTDIEMCDVYSRDSRVLMYRKVDSQIRLRFSLRWIGLVLDQNTPQCSSVDYLKGRLIKYKIFHATGDLILYREGTLTYVTRRTVS